MKLKPARKIIHPPPMYEVYEVYEVQNPVRRRRYKNTRPRMNEVYEV